MRGRRSPSETTGTPRPAYDVALTLLARREYSRRELHARLARDGYDDEAINTALSRLGEARYQDDDRFAGMLVRSRLAQGYGPLRLRAELKSHGLPESDISKWLDDAAAQTDWLALAMSQLKRRYGVKPARDHAERVRRAQFLMRRGFDANTVREATRIDSAEST